MASFVRHLLTIILLSSATISVSAQKLHPYELKFGEFSELKVVDGINVDYYCDPTKGGKVEFEATPETASAVMFEPSKDRLTIKLALRDGSYRDLPTIRVYTSFLTKVENEGDSTVRVMEVVATPKFSCKVIGNGRLSVRNVQANNVEANILSGNGTIAIYGTAETAKLRVTGAGDIQADELKTTNADCSVTGTGSISCYVTNFMKAGGVGSGKIYYRGNPEIKRPLISHVKTIPLDQK